MDDGLHMWLAAGILSYLVLLALFLLFLIGANRTELEDEIDYRISRLRDAQSAPLVRSRLPEEEAQSANALRKTGTTS